MEETIIKIFGVDVRGDFVLMLATIISATLVALISIIARLRKKPDSSEKETEVSILLSKPEIIELIKEGKTSVKEILESTKTETDISKSQKFPFLNKIADDIEWDIAGVIGVGVTVVLLFMVVSGTITKIPEQIFTGWLMILGYYFGKGRKT